MEKHQIFHLKVYPVLEEEAENTDLNKITYRKNILQSSAEYCSDRIGIISSGFVSSTVEKVLNKPDFDREISHLSLNLVNPLPLGKIGTFLRNFRKVLVAEESEPFIEEQIRIAGKICGKKTGHLPYGQVTAEDIEFALEHINEDKVSNSADLDTAFFKKATVDRTTICDNCPYLPLYRFLSTLKVQVAGDMGCSVRSAPEPLAAVDVSFALGSAISVACGFEKKGVAVIGDFAMAHSGILGLINAVAAGCSVLVLILQNEIAAMTGGQKTPDLSKVVEATTPDVSFFALNEVNYSQLFELINEKNALLGISVIFIKGKCRKYNFNKV